MVRADTFQQGMEGFPMVRMFEVTQFMEEYVILQVIRKAHKI